MTPDDMDDIDDAAMKMGPSIVAALCPIFDGVDVGVTYVAFARALGSYLALTATDVDIHHKVSGVCDLVRNIACSAQKQMEKK